MSRRVRTLASFFWPVVLASVFVACADLKRADEPADAGGSEAGDEPITPDDGGADGSKGDGSVPDAGAPPDDFACNGDVWTKTTKTKPECAPRQVKVVDPIAPADVKGISIARTPTGRVGIVYNGEQGSETGDMNLAYFTPTTPAYAAPTIVVKPGGFAFHYGYVAKLAASAPDTLAVLSYDMDDSSRTGEVHLRKLVGGKEPLTDDLMVTGVQDPTEIAVASDGSGNVYASARIATSATTATLSTWKKTAVGPFTKLADVTALLQFKAAPGIGSASIVVDPGGQTHLLYHFNETAIAPQHSNPRYHTLAGTAWSERKTVDNNIIDGLSGYSPRIAVFGTKKYAAYFFRKAGQSVPPTADLRLATWESTLDIPQVEILDQQIPSDDPLYPAYSVAMAVDKFGLVHIALVRPSTNKVGYVEYRRQTRVPAGGTKWLSDIVDDDVISESSRAFVDLVVDENARPHIAYRSAKDGKVRYATRFDR